MMVGFLRSLLAVALAAALAGSGCGRTRLGSAGRPDWSPWVGPGVRARVDSYSKPDLVKGEHHYRVFVVARGRGVSDMDITRQIDDYREATGWSFGARDRRLWIVALHPTVGILDAENPDPSHVTGIGTAWRMSDQLYLIMPESDIPPEPLVFEEHDGSRRAIIDVSWGHLIVLPDEGVVLGVE